MKNFTELSTRRYNATIRLGRILGLIKSDLLQLLHCFFWAANLVTSLLCPFCRAGQDSTHAPHGATKIRGEDAAQAGGENAEETVREDLVRVTLEDASARAGH